MILFVILCIFNGVWWICRFKLFCSWLRLRIWEISWCMWLDDVEICWFSLEVMLLFLWIFIICVDIIMVCSGFWRLCFSVVKRFLCVCFSMFLLDRVIFCKFKCNFIVVFNWICVYCKFFFGFIFCEIVKEILGDEFGNNWFLVKIFLKLLL